MSSTSDLSTEPTDLPTPAEPLRPAGATRPGEGLLLIGHGSRDPEGVAELRAFASDLATHPANSRAVLPCCLELAEPSILDAVDLCAARGFHRLLALPLLLFGANHAKNDIPAALNVARSRYPWLDLRYAAPLGVEPELLRLADQRLATVETSASQPRQQTAVLLVERGSSDPDANAQVYHLARLLWEGRGFGWVEPCFIGITRPSLDEGLERCVRLGAERILVLPYFLFTGVLVRRIGNLVAAARPRYPHVELLVAPHLGRDPLLTELALRRVGEAERGEVRMSCDRCKYRVPLLGFEHQVGQPLHSDQAHGLRRGGQDGQHHHHSDGVHQH